MKNIAIYCGSSKGFNEVYVGQAKKLGSTLVAKGLGMVYGAGSVGLMGEIADQMLAEGGQVIGVIPKFLIDLEVGHSGISQLEIVDNMHVRKARMVELSDAFIAMPGGFGTLDEIFEVLTWSQLDLHNKPVAFYNVNGYYDKLFQFLFQMSKDGFLKSVAIDNIIVEDDPVQLINRLLSYSPKKEEKWIRD